MPKNPNWYYNVKAHPEVKISTIYGHGNYLAEEVSKEKKNELWPLICLFIQTMKLIRIIHQGRYLFFCVKKYEYYRS